MTAQHLVDAPTGGDFNARTDLGVANKEIISKEKVQNLNITYLCYERQVY